MLLAVIVMVALVLIALAVAAPVVARDLRRDKEVESMHRAEQYVRAIRLYQRKFNNSIRRRLTRSKKPTTSATCASNTSTPSPARTTGVSSILAKTKPA